GIPIATVCAEEFGVPLIYAKKAKSENISDNVYTSDIRSYTYNKPVTLTLSKEWLSKDDKVLVIDDFMANGQALSGLIDIIEQAGAELVGIGIAIEKGFQPGGANLRAKGYNLRSLAIIDKADESGFVFRSQE
ncbi:MAG: xanthine phosphoribosyltransferase, partial [Oscillospiraceae bacterium]|nr:xanthine phosphoribosyltransferase [Oscillospiraceae bacterium]